MKILLMAIELSIFLFREKKPKSGLWTESLGKQIIFMVLNIELHFLLPDHPVSLFRKLLIC